MAVANRIEFVVAMDQINFSEAERQNGRPPYPLSAVLLDGAVHTNLLYDQPVAP
ncbi:MAG: hypothetical protein ABJK83_00215 [Parasphingorhabdus sp.]|uniref:hypothetical protein n=1 Tax=Parasphingorhabdus sp. TaxID=2709688 RepID=UPI0032975926